MIKFICIKLLTVISIFIFSIQLCHAEANKIQVLKDMKDFIEKNDLDVFLQAKDENKWKAPVIYSQWHIDNVAEKNTIPEMKAARELGEIIVKRIAEWVKSMHSASTPLQNYKVSEMFLELADWVSESRGYGNLFIASRCQNIASIGIGRLIIDLDYPIDRANRLVDRLEQPWNDPIVRISILNKEAGIDIFKFQSKNKKEIERQLDEVWSYANLLLVKKSADVKGESSKVKEYMNKIIERATLKNLDSSVLRDNLAFFKDDEYIYVSKPITTNKLWDGKWHAKLVVGFDLQSTKELRALSAFRTAVGFFPKSKVEFRNAWDVHSTRENHTLYAPAWRAYDKMQKGTFLDEDTEKERVFNEARKKDLQRKREVENEKAIGE